MLCLSLDHTVVRIYFSVSLLKSVSKLLNSIYCNFNYHFTVANCVRWGVGTTTANFG